MLTGGAGHESDDESGEGYSPVSMVCRESCGGGPSPSSTSRSMVWFQSGQERTRREAGSPLRECRRAEGRRSLAAILVHHVPRRSGANVKAVQRLARHSSSVETVGIYTRLTPEDERDALQSLASVVPTTDSPSEQRATGTDGRSVLGSCLPNYPAKPCEGAPSGATTIPTGGPENAVWGGGSGEDDGTRTRNHRRDRPVL